MRAPSPVIQAGASLKRIEPALQDLPVDMAFPGHPGRGLIEACASARCRGGGGRPSPVIQAGASLKRERGTQTLDSWPSPSPVIQAGASLKQVVGVAALLMRVRPSPVIQAGASLKRCRRPRPLTGVLAFPGHAGRGLIEARRLTLRTERIRGTFPGHPGRGLIEA